MRIAGLLTGLLFTAATFAQSIVTPVFVHKDGDASGRWGRKGETLSVRTTINPRVLSYGNLRQSALDSLVMYLKKYFKPQTVKQI